jgi:hypothetical protein
VAPSSSGQQALVGCVLADRADRRRKIALFQSIRIMHRYFTV